MLFILQREGQFGHKLRLGLAFACNLVLLSGFYIGNRLVIDVFGRLTACCDQGLCPSQITVEYFSR